MAVVVLKKAGLSTETLRRQIQDLAGASTGQAIAGSIPYSPEVRKLMMLAAKEASAFEHTYIGTEHLLLALLSQNEGIMARLLQDW